VKGLVKSNLELKQQNDKLAAQLKQEEITKNSLDQQIKQAEEKRKKTEEETKKKQEELKKVTRGKSNGTGSQGVR